MGYGRCMATNRTKPYAVRFEEPGEDPTVVVFSPSYEVIHEVRGRRAAWSAPQSIRFAVVGRAVPITRRSYLIKQGIASELNQAVWLKPWFHSTHQLAMASYTAAHARWQADGTGILEDMWIIEVGPAGEVPAEQQFVQAAEPVDPFEDLGSGPTLEQSLADGRWDRK